MKNKNEDSTSDKSALTFLVITPFRKEAFIINLLDLFDKRSLKSNKSIIDLDNLSEDWFEDKDLSHFIMACLNGELKTVKQRTAEDVLRGIFSDWYNTTYQVKMDNDSFEQMSPGKKSLVLLKLIIELAESTCPILIDQPEDDWDNRSIFDELIPFIKDKKNQRQIIIVTHNANIVVGSDAEEVIVANQNGINTPNEVFCFEYRSDSIEEDQPIEGSNGVLGKCGIQQHICDILEGGKEAFDLRKNKYIYKLVSK